MSIKAQSTDYKTLYWRSPCSKACLLGFPAHWVQPLSCWFGYCSAHWAHSFFQPAELNPSVLFSHPPTLDLEELGHHGLPCVATVPLLFMVTLILKLVQRCDSSVVKPSFHGVETLVPRGESDCMCVARLSETQMQNSDSLFIPTSEKFQIS